MNLNGLNLGTLDITIRKKKLILTEGAKLPGWESKASRNNLNPTRDVNKSNTAEGRVES